MVKSLVAMLNKSRNRITTVYSTCRMPSSPHVCTGLNLVQAPIHENTSYMSTCGSLCTTAVFFVFTHGSSIHISSTVQLNVYSLVTSSIIEYRCCMKSSALTSAGETIIPVRATLSDHVRAGWFRFGSASRRRIAITHF